MVKEHFYGKNGKLLVIHFGDEDFPEYEEYPTAPTSPYSTYDFNLAAWIDEQPSDKEQRLLDNGIKEYSISLSNRVFIEFMYQVDKRLRVLESKQPITKEQFKSGFLDLYKTVDES